MWDIETELVVLVIFSNDLSNCIKQLFLGPRRLICSIIVNKYSLVIKSITRTIRTRSIFDTVRV